MKEIKKITVLGSGTMGSGIVAHLANAGFKEIYMLDILPPKLTDEQIEQGYTLEDKNIRNLLARKNLNTLLASKPPQLGSKKLAKYITIGNTTDDFDKYVSESDWIIEVVPEIAKLKNDTFKKIDKIRKPDSIITSNTSGTPIKEMLEGCSDELKENFLVTHFFNPVRFMTLLEIITTSTTKPEILEMITKIGEEKLGKGIVHSYDVPGFITNRIGGYFMMKTLSLLGEYDIETLNNVFDKKLGYGGKPFSTCDLVGIDILYHVMNDIHNKTSDESNEVFKIPEFMENMIKKGLLGRKTGAGFFKRDKEKKKDFVIDPETLEHVPKKNPKIESIERAKKAGSLEDAVKIMYNAEDVGGDIYKAVITDWIRYAFARTPEVSPNGIEGVDKAIKRGFNQKLGPGELLDIIGADKVIENIEKSGKEVPNLLRDLQQKGKVYVENDKGEDLVFSKEGYKKIEKPEKYSSFKELAKTTKPLFEIKKSGRVYHLDNDIFAVEMLTKNGIINMELIDTIYKALDLVELNGRGLIIGNDLENFSFGADLDMLLGHILRGKRDSVETVTRRFQMLNHKLKFAKVPVVVMKRGMALGGGCELGYGAHIRAAHDSYIGLVEVGVGLIPGGGGTKETLVRKYKKYAGKQGSKPLDYIQETLMQIANPLENVAVSAHQAKELGYMSEDDGISMNSDFLLYDAKQDVIRLSKDYKPPEETYVELPGRDMRAALYTGIDLFAASNKLTPKKVPKFITKQFELILKTLADVVSGGDILPPGKKFSELELLDMEREAFLRLTTDMSLKEKFAWLNIAADTLKKNRSWWQPYAWAFKSIKNSYFNKELERKVKEYD